MSKAPKVVAAKKSNKNSGDTGYLKTFRILLLFGLLFVMFYTPFLRGLYFESEQLFTEIVLLSIFILFWVHKWLNKDKAFIRTPIEYASLGLVLVYLLTTFTAVNQRLAATEFLKYAMYFIVFIMLSDLVKSEKEKTYVFWTIAASAFGVCIIGIDSVAGGKIVNIFNTVFKALKINVSFFGLYVDGRIHSTIQYPNALASYLMAVFFITLGLVLTSKKWWVKGIASSIGFVLLTTFIFTLSRGVYILLLLALPLYLLLLPKGTKARGVYCLVTLLGITGPLAIVLSMVINNESG
ncbi:MAG: hypothetical protein GX660_15945, partial [Clostridiaceae bacterium]|nr:hypothetical protein [Clostridiaceae bacterium]